MKRIFQVHLRTLDVDAARDFYRSVLGNEPARTVRLHDHALARGAKPHWLGYIDVGDVEPAVAAFEARGAVSFGPKWIDPQGLEAGVMRDPGGAIIALAKPPPPRERQEGESERAVPELGFHALNTVDVARAMKAYGEMFGWQFGEPLDVGSEGAFRPFQWEAGGPMVGVFAGIEGRPGVHPHWTFGFRVPSLDAAIARVRSGGGLALDPVQLRSGDRLAICDDPQGAAFGLHESR